MHRLTVRLLVALIACALTGLTPVVAQADDTRLDAQFAVSATTVTVTGTLSADGKPLKRREVQALLDGKVVGAATTTGNGGFALAFRLPDNGDHVATVRFPGGKGAEGAEVSTHVRAEGQGGQVSLGPPQPGQDSDKDPGTEESKPVVKPPDPVKLKLSASGPETALNGEVITISGRLTTSAGKGVGGAGIEISDKGGQVDESFTVTEDDGRFTAMYFIPDEQADGTMGLTVTFEGGQGYAVSTAKVSVEVIHTEMASEEPAPESPVPTTAPEDVAVSAPAAEVTPTPTPTPEAAPPTPATDDQPMAWFYAALVAVGGLAVIAIGVLGFRGWVTRLRGADESSGALDFLDDDDEFDGDEGFFDGGEETAVLDPTQRPGEETALLDAAEVPGEDTAVLDQQDLGFAPEQERPRRGLPADD